MATLRGVVPIAIMPGKDPLGTPRGISPELQKRIAQFYEAHGTLSTILLVTRELRPKEALSWSAYLALGNNLPGIPGRPETPLVQRPEKARAIGEENAPAGEIGPDPGKRCQRLKIKSVPAGGPGRPPSRWTRK